MIRPRRRVKMNISMCLACILFCLTLFSIYLTSGLYARYTTSDIGEDMARVISFGSLTLTETGDFGSDGTMMIIPGVNLAKSAVVDFTGSEVATYVFVEVVVSSHWAIADNKVFSVNSNKMQWTVADGWNYLKSIGDGSDTTYVYYRKLAPNTSLSTEVIAGGVVYVSPDITKNEIGSMSGISIKFRATAVQIDGFEGGMQ